MNKKLRMAGAILLSAVMMFSISAFAENSADDTNIISEEMTENESSGKKVYFAGPLFNQAEKDFNLELTKVLEERSMATRFSCRSVMG